MGAFLSGKKVLANIIEEQLEDLESDAGQLLQEAQHQIQKALVHDPQFQK
jgi:hypothetical protein